MRCLNDGTKYISYTKFYLYVWTFVYHIGIDIINSLSIKGIDQAKIYQIRYFNCLQKKGLYVLVDNVPKYNGASATVKPPKLGPKGEKYSYFYHVFL